jgi:hypothetical protein
MTFEEIENCWHRLDPVFVRGMQRSGTSVMGYALQKMGIVGFGEGHLWYELLKPITRLRDPDYFPDYREDIYTLGQERLSKLEKYISVALDKFHRDSLPSDLKRWADKSPGADAVRVIPLLADLFPQAQIIFVYRNGITNVLSGIKFWKDAPDIFHTMCQGWVETMSTWRRVRDVLGGRYIEIAQEDMVIKPFGVATRLTDFLDMPSCCMTVTDLLASQRVLSAFPDKRPGDYNYRIDWGPQQKEFFIKMCGPEMEAWGYDIDFDSPGVVAENTLTPEQRAVIAEIIGQHDAHIAATISQRDSRIAELEREYLALREHLTRVEQGRTMRLLNSLNHWRARLFQRNEEP